MLLIFASEAPSADHWGRWDTGWIGHRWLRMAHLFLCSYFLYNEWGSHLIFLPSTSWNSLVPRNSDSQLLRPLRTGCSEPARTQFSTLSVAYSILASVTAQGQVSMQPRSSWIHCFPPGTNAHLLIWVKIKQSWFQPWGWKFRRKEAYYLLHLLPWSG